LTIVSEPLETMLVRGSLAEAALEGAGAQAHAPAIRHRAKTSTAAFFIAADYN
jgi:hypothetical protein